MSLLLSRIWSTPFPGLAVESVQTASLDIQRFKLGFIGCSLWNTSVGSLICWDADSSLDDEALGEAIGDGGGDGLVVFVVLRVGEAINVSQLARVGGSYNF